jgi:hypothetical protein
VKFQLQMTVHRQFVIAPRFIDFGRTVQGQHSARVISITTQSQSARILGVTSTDPMVSPVLSGLGSRSSVMVRIGRNSDALGWHSGNIIIRTSSPHEPELRVPVRGAIVGTGFSQEAAIRSLSAWLPR